MGKYKYIYLEYKQNSQVHLKCSINLNKLFQTQDEMERFKVKWPEFLDSDPHNREIYQLKNNRLTYLTEQLIPSKTDDRTPLLFVFGNPASHSVSSGMFFSFEGNGKEHRFWKNILKPSGILDLSFDNDLPVNEKNDHRLRQLIELDYDSDYCIGFSVFISMASAPSGKWSGVSGIQKLLGAKAMRRLEKDEVYRIIESSKAFLRGGEIMASFQKNAWNGLRSEEDPEYNIALAKKGKLKGKLRETHIPLIAIPPTRLIGPCKKILNQFFIQQ